MYIFHKNKIDKILKKLKDFIQSIVYTNVFFKICGYSSCRLDINILGYGCSQGVSISFPAIEVAITPVLTGWTT